MCDRTLCLKNLRVTKNKGASVLLHQSLLSVNMIEIDLWISSMIFLLPVSIKCFQVG